VPEAHALEGVEDRSRRERARAVGADDALAGRNPGCRVAAGRRRQPVLEVAGRQRDVARRAGGAAGRIDPDDLGSRGAEVRADRVVGGARLPDLLLLGERKTVDLREPACRSRGGEARRRQLLAIEARALEEVGQLLAIARVVEGELLCPGAGFDLGREYQRGPSSGGGSYSIASSACPAIRKPSGRCCSSAR